MFLLRTILNIKVTVSGVAEQFERGGTVIISNHFGYIDGFVLGSIFPAVFVTKREVKKWPVIGLWTTLYGTIFIDRQRKDQVGLLVSEMSRKLKQGANILLFPEGRATNGERMLPFQTAPLAAPLRNRSIIVPVTLVYKRIDDKEVSKANRDLIYCYDDMDFVPHFWKLLSLRSIEAVVTVQPNIECSRYEDNSAGRKKLALDCYHRVLEERVTADLPQEEKRFSKLARSLTWAKVGRVAFVLVCLTAGAGNAFAQQPAPKAAPAAEIDPKAIDALKAMGAQLRALKAFALRSETTIDEVAGQRAEGPVWRDGRLPRTQAQRFAH
jgi:1-acyl-sn-glycerol-3-phosphate acyltransferase